MTKETKLKEIIYIDDDLVNSFLSQFNQGLVETIAKTNEAISGQTEINTNSKGHNEMIGTKYIKGESIKSVQNAIQQQTQDAFSSTVNTIFYDYAVEKLRNRLFKNNLLKKSSGGKIAEGNFVEFSSYANFINLGELHDLLSKKKFSELTKNSMDENNNTDFSNEDLVAFTDIASEIFGNVTMIKIKNNLIITKPECFRINASQLQLFKNNDRKLTILGIVESTFKDSNINFNDVSSLISSMKLEILLDLDIIQENTNFILPIALYFK